MSFSTPATDESALDYLRRNGRWSRNWQNFHPNPGHIDAGLSDLSNHECDRGEVCGPNFGRDVCYNAAAFGQSSTSGIFNPAEASDYMRSEATRWLMWMKNQAGVDGFRWDAAKHFDSTRASPNADHGTIAAVMKPFGANPDMVSVAEVVDSADNQDAWANTANTDAGSDIVGTFDFSLRNRLHDMVLTFGSFDMQSIPSAQQQDRSRTVPFVNNHDTDRPIPMRTAITARWAMPAGGTTGTSWVVGTSTRARSACQAHTQSRSQWTGRPRCFSKIFLTWGRRENGSRTFQLRRRIFR